MGIITKIEDKLGDLVENPFRDRNVLDPLSMEICLKRLIELKRKNILGKVIVPNDLMIVINEKEFQEYEPFLEEFKGTMQKNLCGWMREKGYEMTEGMKLTFKEEPLETKPFETVVSYKKAKNSKGNNDQTDSTTDEEKDHPQAGRVIIGELIDKRAGKRFKIDRNTTIIGRGEDCAIRIDDPTVSRKHASLSFHHGKGIIGDLGSKSGTRVNCERVHKKILSSGDRIEVGSTELTFVEAGRISGGGECNLAPGEKTKGTTCFNSNLLGLSYFF